MTDNITESTQDECYWSHSAGATTTVQFGDGPSFRRRFCETHARRELAKHDGAEVVDDREDS